MEELSAEGWSFPGGWGGGSLGCHPPLSLELRGPLCFMGQCPERLPPWPERPTPTGLCYVHVMVSHSEDPWGPHSGLKTNQHHIPGVPRSLLSHSPHAQVCARLHQEGAHRETCAPPWKGVEGLLSHCGAPRRLKNAWEDTLGRY